MTEESYIKIAIELAKKGKGNVSPGPLSGVLFVKKGKIVGAGYSDKENNNSAEQFAIASSKENLAGSILYSNIESGPGQNSLDDFVLQLKELNISKVVYGTTNPHPEIMGKSIEKIKNSGIETKVGVLEKDCTELNKFYFKSLSEKRPYITLKIALTLDGKIADQKGQSKWISSLDSRCRVHELRAFYDAVLVGKNTVLKDDPELNVRLVEGRDPKRVVIDPRLKIPFTCKLMQKSPENNIIVTSISNINLKNRKSEKLVRKGVKLLDIPLMNNGDLNLRALMKKLFAENITSVLVEGGSRTFSEFIKNKLYDEVLLFMSPKLLGMGLSVVENIGVSSIRNALKLKLNGCEQIGDDILISLVK